jgi:phosphoglycolate phosphatase
MSNHVRAVLFDFDGTLADSYAAITASVNHVRAAHGLAPLAEDEVRRYVGRGMPYLLERTVPGCDQAVDQARYRRHHPTVMRPLTRLLPGADELLAELKRLGKRIAVCSNKPRTFTQELLDYLRIGRYIDAILGPEDVARAKPAPDMVLAALKRLDAAPSAALYVGDMGVDIETARAAGVAVWVVTTGSDAREALEAAGPDRIFRDLTEMLGLLT